jgi:hypothetical protein
MRWEQFRQRHEHAGDQGRRADVAVRVLLGDSGAPAGDPRQTYVEFRLETISAGTRLTVTESGFAQLPDEWLEASYQGNTEGWRRELDEQSAYLDAA